MLSLKYVVVTSAIIAFASNMAVAETTEQLLSRLVLENPLLAAAKDDADAARADLFAARGQWLPQVSIEASASSLDETLRVDALPGELSASRQPRQAQAVVDQAVFTSGRLSGSVGVAHAAASSAKHNYDALRQDVIFQGISAIADVVRDRAIVSERQENERVVRGRLTESKARRRAGLATETDVQQAEARLAEASARRLAATGTMQQTEARFLRIFGEPAALDLRLPQHGRSLPNHLEEALELAERSNPQLAVSEDDAQAARLAVRAERGARLPQVSLNATAGYIDNERFGIELGEAEQYTVSIQGRWSLFSGGSGFAKTKAARRRADAARHLAHQARREARERTIAAWADVLTGRSVLEARKLQVTAAATAARGVAAEFQTGRRTRLDVLDADREKTDADVALLSARRDLLVAEYALLRAVGAL